MLASVSDFYVSFMPVILGGILNSVVTKSHWLPMLNKPLDHGTLWSDKRRLFGASKTYRGLVGYVLLTGLFSLLWWWLSSFNATLLAHNLFYQLHTPSALYSLGVGCLLGLAWALFELPNSFIKRRLNVSQSYQQTGWKKWAFVITDQADSIISVVLVLACFYPLSLGLGLFFVGLGTFTHLLVNYCLYLCKLRRHPV